MQRSSDIKAFRKHAWPMLILFFSLSLIGLLSLQHINLSLLPKSSKKQIIIHYSWRDATAFSIEKNITSILESGISNIKGIKEIRSLSGDGYGQISILTDKFEDTQHVRYEILNRIRQLYPVFPKSVSFPRLSYTDTEKTGDGPMMTYILSANDSPENIQEVANDILKRNLSSLSGIKMIRVLGGSKAVQTIEYDQQKCESFNITTDDILNALQQYFARKNLGAVPHRDKNKVLASNIIRLNVENGNKINWQQIPIKKVADRIVLLGNIAETYKAAEKQHSIYRINGMEAIHILIYPEEGSNQLKTSRQIRVAVRKIGRLLPYYYQLFLSDDTSLFVDKELRRIIWRTFFTFLVLLVFLVLINNNGPYLLTIFASLILNICIGFLLYWLFHIEIHLYSLAGITISLGMMIDNSIIMTDHLFFRKNIRVFLAILASTLTSIAALILIELLPDSIKLQLHDFMMVIVINLLVSLFVALFFVPALASQFKYFKSPVKRKKLKRIRKVIQFNVIYQNLITVMLRRKHLAFFVIVVLFGIPTFMLPGSIPGKGPISKLYNGSIGSDWYARNLMPYTDAFLGGSFRLFYQNVLKKSTKSRLEKTELRLSTKFPYTYNLEQMNDIIQDIEEHLNNYRGIEKYISRINANGEARINISFKKGIENTSYPYLLKNHLISYFINRPVLDWKVYGIGRGFNQKSGSDESSRLGLRLSGFELQKLDTIAEQVRHKLMLHPRIKDVWYAEGIGTEHERKQEAGYDIFPKKELLQLYDLSQMHLYQYLLESDVKSNHSFQFVEEGELKTFTLVKSYHRPKDMWNITHKSSALLNGTSANNYILIRERQPSPKIRKINQQYIKDIQFEYLGGIKYGVAFRDKIVEEIRNILPVGYHLKTPDFNFLKKDPMKFYLMLIIVLVIFTVCSILFESFLQPLAIILSIPISFMGVFISFYLFKLNFDQGGYAALLLLGGLSVNASIYIINDFNNFCKAKDGRKRISLYIKAFNAKIIPVILTLSSTILGLLPFLSMGKDEAFWFAFAAATCSGLLFTLLAVVFVLPLVLLQRKDLPG